MPSTRPTILRARQRLVQHERARTARVQIGIVYARIADAAGGHLLHAEQDQAVPAGDVEERERQRPCPRARAGCGSNRPTGATPAASPSAANGSVDARNVSGASSVTPIFSTGQLHPQTSVRMPTEQQGSMPAAHAGVRDAPRSSHARPSKRRSWAGRVSQVRAGGSPYLRLVQRSAPASPIRRAGCGPETRAACASNSSMSRSRPARDLPETS